MKKHTKELIILILQLIIFYLFPLTAGPTDAIGMVVLIILATFVLSLVLGSISENKLRFIYPLLVAILFIPSVFIYYNETALIHSVWYLIISALGLISGLLIRFIVKTIGQWKG